MKKLCLTLMVLLSGIFMLHSEYEYIHQMSKPLELQAAYGKVAYVSVTPIPAQGQSYIQGMPFNIEESYVLSTITDENGKVIPGSENGRLIANWSLISNTKVKLRISTTPMKHVSKNSSELSYYLHFTYLAGYTNASGDEIPLNTEYFNIPMKDNDPVTVVRCDKTDTVSRYENTYEVDPFAEVSADFSNEENMSYIGSLDGGIYFQFDEDSTELIYREKGNADSTSIPAGNYTASVLIEMVSQE